MFIAEPERLTMNAAACDGPECDTWSREPENHGFLELIWGARRFIFCSTDCCLKYLADNSSPMIVIPLE